MPKFGDTPAFNKPHLCNTCSYGTVVDGVTYNQKLTFCQRMPDGATIPFKVAECSGYADKTQPSMFDMQRIAWRIASDKKTKKIGFYAPSKYYSLIKEEKIDALGDESAEE